MSDMVRVLNGDGITLFAQFLTNARLGTAGDVPRQLLNDSRFSSPAAVEARVENRAFENRYIFGRYLYDVLGGVRRSVISRDHGLWTWLALYYFDTLCPAAADGSRKVLRQEAYVLPSRPDYARYYRHLVRTPWLAVALHGEAARVLLISPGKPGASSLSRRGELIEQLASRQNIFGNGTIVSAADMLYFDPAAGRPRRGSGGAGPGSPRRLATVVDQLELTYDLRNCTPERFLALLPAEFRSPRSERLERPPADG